jgi:hypothetical protein
MQTNAEEEAPQTLAWRLIDRCRRDIEAAWIQLEAARRSLGLLPIGRYGMTAGRRGPHVLKTPERQPRSLAKTSPLRLRKKRSTRPRSSGPMVRFPESEREL